MATSPLSLSNVFDLKDRIAVVTGGGTGIGWMIAQGFATNGAKVYITGRRKDVLEKAIAAFGKQDGFGDIVPLEMDVTDRDSISAAQKEIQAKEGRVHILINNAGQVGPVSHFFSDASSPERQSAETLGQALFQNESFDAWSQLYSINVSSIFFMTTAFLGLLAKGSEDRAGYNSCVVNITSISGKMRLSQDHFAYNSSKAAAAHLTKLFATEFALKKIPVRVCGIAPGVFASQMTEARLAEGPEAVDIIARGVLPVPAQRPGTPQEMVGTVIALVSPAGGYINGVEVVIDGGFLCVNPSVA